VGDVRHPQHTQTSSNSSTIAADSSNGVTNTNAVHTVVCAPDDGWKYHPKHVEQFPDINKLCNFVSCWVYEYIGILLGSHPVLHISRIRVNKSANEADLDMEFRYGGEANNNQNSLPETLSYTSSLSCRSS
jgi:hypothetical protein